MNCLVLRQLQLQLRLLSLSAGLAVAGLSQALPAGAELPPAATHPIDFAGEIRPLLEQRCAQCHGRGKSKGGFRLDTRELFLKGGDSGPAVIAGDSSRSHLVKLVAGTDPENVMPEKGTRLTSAEVGLLRAWVDQGVRWPNSVTFARPEPLNLAARKPDPPRRSGMRNPVDRWVDSTFKTHAASWPEAVGDAAFARRAWLDVVGVLPSVEELHAFTADRAANKRERLVRRLLADGTRYAEHWLSFWNDSLRNDYRGTGYIDGGRKQITTWLFSALATNMPFDRFVAELVNPNTESEGFTKGIVWRGVVNASQVPEMQAAQNISQVFLGTNLKCASCHDSFINDWTLAEAYGLAALYAENPIEIHRCDKSTGEKAVSSFIFPQVGSVHPAAPKAERLKQLAAAITSRNNGRLTRTIVNRVWARLMGRGLIEPVEDMNQKAWNQDLLDWLAEDLAAHGYDLKRTFELILTSRAYQLPAVGAAETEAGSFVFRGPLVRRLSAEQFRDALGAVTTLWFDAPRGDLVDFWNGLDPKPRAAKIQAALPSEPAWIWSTPEGARDGGNSTAYFRKTFELAGGGEPESAFLVAAADDQYTLYINGAKVASGRNYKRPQIENVRSRLVPGRNVIAVSVTNGEQPGSAETRTNRPPNPAGLLTYLDIRSAPSSGAGTGQKTAFRVITDKSWLVTTAKSEGWETPSFDPKGWVAAVPVGRLAADPWAAKPFFIAAISNLDNRGRIRASLVEADPMMTALGRPNREQTVLARASSATTLQALELTNGQTLDRLLKEGAKKLAAEAMESPVRFVRRISLTALAREPSPQEQQLALETLGSPPSVEGLQDFLWMLAMLPEFQLIR